MQQILKTAKFIQGANSIRSFARSNLDEIAIVGRSNVGKSTFLNSLAGNSKLSRTSSTPGRTQEINFFEFVFKDDRKLFLADLPGFGYAKFSKVKREELSKLTVEYLTKRKQLQVLCLLNDCRRDPVEEEIAIRDLAFNNDLHCLIVLTKTDKLSNNELSKQIKKISSLYNLQPEDVLLSSNKLKTEKFWQRISLLVKSA